VAPDHAGNPIEIGFGCPHKGHGLTGGQRSVPWSSVRSLLESGEAILAHDQSPMPAWGELQAARKGKNWRFTCFSVRLV